MRPRAGGLRNEVASCPNHITLDRNQTVALLDCLLKAAEHGERTGNLELAAMALYCADLIIDKWFPEGDSDV